MKNYSNKISSAAQRDIVEILDYIAIELCAPMSAIKLNVKIMEAFERLQDFPLSGTVLTCKPSCRWVRVENYMIFYTVDEKEQTVTILRVLYSSSDYLSTL